MASPRTIAPPRPVSHVEDDFLPPSSDCSHSSLRISLGKNRHDGEIDIFSAEKYFSGTCMDVKASKPTADEKVVTVETKFPKKSTSCSESTDNSRSTLLLRHRRRKPPPTEKEEAGISRKAALTSAFLRCICCSKKTVLQDSSKKSQDHHSSFSDECIQDIKKMGFRLSLEKRLSIGMEESAIRSRRMSLSVLNVSGAAASAGGDQDCTSDSSSDLFEIESLSINSQSFSQPENFSVAPCSSEGRKKQQRPGMLLGCVSEKAVESFVPPPTATVRYGSFGGGGRREGGS